MVGIMETNPISQTHEIASVKGVKRTSESSSCSVVHVEKKDTVELSEAARSKLDLEQYVEALKAMPEIRPQVIETAREKLSEAEKSALIAEKMREEM